MKLSSYQRYTAVSEEKPFVAAEKSREKISLRSTSNEARPGSARTEIDYISVSVVDWQAWLAVHAAEDAEKMPLEVCVKAMILTIQNSRQSRMSWVWVQPAGAEEL